MHNFEFWEPYIDSWEKATPWAFLPEAEMAVASPSNFNGFLLFFLGHGVRSIALQNHFILQIRFLFLEGKEKVEAKIRGTRQFLEAKFQIFLLNSLHLMCISSK